MTEQIILILGMAAAFVFGIVTASRKSTDARKWALIAFAGMFVFMCATYMTAHVADKEAFVFMKEAALIGSALSAGAFALAAASAGNATPDKNIYKGFIGTTALFTLAAATMRLHGMGVTNISFGSADESGLYSPAFTRGTIYIAATIVYGVAVLATAIYTAANMFRRKEKPSSMAAFSAVVAVILPVALVLSLFDVIPGNIVRVIIMVAAAFILFILVTVTDRSDVLDFANSNCINSINDGLIILDAKGKFLFANRTAKRLFIEFSENDSAKIAEVIKTLPEKGEITRGEHVYSISRSTYTDYSGKCDCTALIVQDVTEQQLQSDRLAKEAAVDSITGISSKSEVVKTLSSFCEQGDGTLIIVSFDGFKAINSVYGHEEANELLKTFGTLLKNNTNTDDIRGRFGGENFVIFLKGCSSESVIANLTMRLEEQATAAVKKQLGDSVSISVGVSAGAVFVPKYGRDFDKLTGYAETAQQKIKNSGGHGYAIYGVDGVTADTSASSDGDNYDDFLTESKQPEPTVNDSETGAFTASSSASDDDSLFVEIESPAAPAEEKASTENANGTNLDKLFTEIEQNGFASEETADISVPAGSGESLDDLFVEIK